MRIGKFLRISMFLSILLSSVVLLGGCVGDQFTDKEKEALEDRGEEMMKSWLSLNRPTASISSCNAYIDIVPSGPRYLTDYIDGNFEDKGKTIHYMLDTISGDVYTDECIGELQEPAKVWILDNLGLNASNVQFEEFEAGLLIPLAPEGSDKKVFHEEMAFSVMPAGVSDAKGFIRDPGRTLPVNIQAVLKVPDGTDLMAYNLDRIRDMRASAGIWFEWLDIKDGNGGCASITNGYLASACLYTETDFGDFSVIGQSAARHEKMDFRTGKIVKEYDETYDMRQDVSIEKTTKGYRIRYSDVIHKPNFRIIAKEGSEILGNEYRLVFEGDNESGSKPKRIRNCQWEPLGNGRYELKEADGGVLIFSLNCDLLIRELQE